NLKWDLAIAPLEDTLFNRYKSDIKFLDYSALGIATLCSRVRAYDGSVRHQVTGYLAENDPQAWYEGLEHMLQDDEGRVGMASQAQEYVFSERTLQRRASEWWEAMKTILDSSPR
ncbi:MAG: glycosyltransferase, partial [Anaerolineales bacterium]